MALAYMGDAIYEVYVRQHLLMQEDYKALAKNTREIHRQTIRYVNAAGQAYAIRQLFDTLTEEEQRLVKRARNHKSSSRPQNQSPLDYRWATAFEALLGYCHLMERYDREAHLAQEAIRLIQQRQETKAERNREEKAEG